MDTPYDLIDQTIDLLAADPDEAKKQVVTPLRQWQNTVREAGLPVLAYDLEQLELAIEKVDAQGIRSGLTRVAKQTRDAAQTTDGVLRSKLDEMAISLDDLAEAFDTTE